jgi:hypothetical protein
MKKNILLAIVAIITLYSCEQDTICIDPITPTLVIRFYDYDNPSEVKSVESLTVWAAGKDSLYTNQTTDSISIPLDINENNTIYNLASESVVDTINFTYTRSDVFVSRSCGYKTIYENFTNQSNSNNWIKEIEIINTIINNDTAAQVYIYH